MEYPDQQHPAELEYHSFDSKYYQVELEFYDCEKIDCILKIYIGQNTKNSITYQTCQDNSIYLDQIYYFTDTLYVCQSIQSQNILIITGIIEILYDNALLCCKSKLCTIYMSMNIYSDQTVNILKEQNWFVNFNNLNLFTCMDQSYLILYIDQQQDIQIRSNTTLYMKTCEFYSIFKQTWNIVQSLDLHLEQGYYCIIPTDPDFYVTVFQYSTVLYDNIEFYNKGIQEWQIAKSNTLYVVIQFKLYSPQVIFKYSNYTEVYSQSQQFVIVLNDHIQVQIDGDITLKTYYTNYSCFLTSNPQVIKNDQNLLYLLASLNSECSPIEISIRQGDYVYNCQNSLILKQQLVMTTDLKIHLIIFTSDINYDYFYDLQVDPTIGQYSQFIIYLCTFILIVIFIRKIIGYQQQLNMQQINIKSLELQNQAIKLI